jgi:glycosyltransferase involved in cell wall biosynthesis
MMQILGTSEGLLGACFLNESHICVIDLIDIILVKSDSIVNQSSIRAKQIIRSLKKKYSILTLGWNRRGIPHELSDDDSTLQLFNFTAPYGYERYGAFRVLAYFPFFWIWVFIKLCLYRPKIIHACDLATILPCYVYKVLFRKKLVFDVVDRYSMVYIPMNRNIIFKILYLVVNLVEEYFAKKSDVLMAVSEKMFLTFRKKPRNCITIMNCCEDRTINRSRTQANSFKLIFTGHISTGRGLEELCNIVTDLNDLELIITGKIKDKDLKDKIDGIPNIKYHGFLDYDKLIDLEASCDVLVALYDLSLQSQYEFGMGNKILEAMMCGLPVISNIAHEIINETGCGIIVEYGNVAQIKEAIITIQRNVDLRRSFGHNGRKAFLEKYNWNRMEQKLFEIYGSLIKK